MANPLTVIKSKLPRRAAALISSEVNRRYLTGFASSDGYIFLSRGVSVFLTDSRYIEAAQAVVTALPVAEATDPFAQLKALCKANHISRLFVETESTTLNDFARLKKGLRGVHVNRRNALPDTTLRELRRIKSADEAACIRKAQGIAEAAFAHILQHIKVGMTEREIALELDYLMLRGGAQALSFETIAVAGENGSLPHGVPGERPVQQGDLLTLDFGAVYNGYHSDMTRTVAVGESTDKQREVYYTVRKAQQAALDKIAPGVPCREIDRAAREVIEAAGYGEYFRHSTGHGVGLEVHEAPTLYKKSDVVLAAGMVITVEPGIYLPGECGVRIEDMALVTEAGYENLTKTGKELISVI